MPILQKPQPTLASSQRTKMETSPNATPPATIRAARTALGMPIQWAVLATSLAVVAAHAQSPLTVTLTPSADAFVRSADAGHNYGGAGALSVSGSAAVNGSGQQNGLFDSLLQFQLGSAIASFDSTFGAGNWTLSSATLRLTEVAAPGNTLFNRGIGSFQISWMANDSWLEGSGSPTAPATDGVTYDALPSLLLSSSTVSLGTFANAGQNTQQEFALPLSDGTFLNDLTSGGTASFYLTAASPGVGFTFDSRNFGTASARPILEVTAVPEPGVIVMAMVGGLGLLVGCGWRSWKRHEKY
jgi:hypothetical protein